MDNNIIPDTHSGDLEFTATGVANSEFSGSNIAKVSLSGTVLHKNAKLEVDPASITLNTITSGDDSDVKSTDISSENDRILQYLYQQDSL